MLEVGKKCKTGQVVSEILGQGNLAACFFTEDNHIRWEYFENQGQVPANMMPAVNTFDNILKNIAASVPKDIRRHYYEHAAKSLYSAFHVNDPYKISEAYQDIQKSLTDIRSATLFYSISGVITSILFIILTFFLMNIYGTNNNVVYFWAPICGMSGATLSVLQRGRKLWPDPNTSLGMVITQGAMRSLTGGLLGIAAVLLIKGKFILGSTENTFEVIVAVSFMFGLGERIVPELTQSIERRVLNDNGG